MRHLIHLSSPKITVVQANVFDDIGDWFDDHDGNDDKKD
jgi:hypothetical protein